MRSRPLCPPPPLQAVRGSWPCSSLPIKSHAHCLSPQSGIPFCGSRVFSMHSEEAPRPTGPIHLQREPPLLCFAFWFQSHIGFEWSAPTPLSPWTMLFLVYNFLKLRLEAHMHVRVETSVLSLGKFSVAKAFYLLCGRIGRFLLLFLFFNLGSYRSSWPLSHWIARKWP